MIRRPLWYPQNYGKPGCYEAAREKGIDVSLAIDVVKMALGHQLEVGIVFSRDTDLLPAVELAFDLPDCHIEVATWEGASQLRLQFRQLFCHKLSHADFIASRETRQRS